MEVIDRMKKCLSCLYGVQDGRDVRCTHGFHPGVVGGCGTEWVEYCHEYHKDSRGTKHLESRVVYDVVAAAQAAEGGET